MKNVFNSFIIGMLLFSCNSPVKTFEIESGDYDRSNLPLNIKTTYKLDAGKSYYLQNIDNGNMFPVQVMAEDSLLVMVDELSAGSSFTYELIQGTVSESPFPKVSIQEDQEGVQFRVNESPVLFYQTATAYPGDSLPDYYKRSGFIHPLHSPKGEILTDDFPVGHVHQHAIFNAWTNTTYKGEKVDFWNQQEELGTVEHVEILEKNEGPLVSTLKSKLNHISRADGPVLEEEWVITVYPVSDYFMFDLFSEQTNISQDTLFINDYHYGGMAFRGSREWNDVDSLHYTNQWKILTSEGRTLEDANHTKAKWVDATGEINGNPTGLTVFGYPDNFRYPQSMRVHPDMPYWVFSPMVEGAFYIAPGEKHISKHRFFVHDGIPDQNILEKIQNDLENPVTVKEL